ncbi:heme-dependent oxidative N-demethylase subunit alpha family protein [Pseudonocardia sp. ICBG1293]|uniref:heme-dependent oxidative N-demethylase subunit alpha family protein n=1 Tax=Pseudonocardia sp. ICBG1293 TaxID=2844382 RepID=UPI001CCEE232|nr:heme-dependent oxidative N-demethylase subunit alpha family protein [Pseudonocardia sp. ICBG1293]
MTGVGDYPFPLPHPTYRISANVEPAGVERRTEAGSWGARILHDGPDRVAVADERATVLDREPARFVAAPHARASCWDACLYLLGRLAAEQPATCTLTRTPGTDGGWRFRDTATGTDREFVFGDDATLPEHPLRWVSRLVAEDLAVLGARDDALWLDSGAVAFASVWSLGFDAGMSFREPHGPVPGNGPGGVFERAERFLLRLLPGEAYRRLNWGLQPDARRDLSLDAAPLWQPTRDRPELTDPGRQIHLRTEVQHLVRLPLTGAVLFLIGTRLLPLDTVARVPAWRHRLASVLETLPPEVMEYKELGLLAPTAAGWLRAQP